MLLFVYSFIKPKFITKMLIQIPDEEVNYISEQMGKKGG